MFFCGLISYGRFYYHSVYIACTVCLSGTLVFVYLWFALIKNNGNTRLPAWYVENLPDEKLVINELGPYLLAYCTVQYVIINVVYIG